MVVRINVELLDGVISCLLSVGAYAFVLHPASIRFVVAVTARLSRQIWGIGEVLALQCPGLLSSPVSGQYAEPFIESKSQNIDASADTFFTMGM